MSTMTYSDVEREVIVLTSVWKMIDDMVNFSVFSKFERKANTILAFNDASSSRLFSIVLADFLSPPGRDFKKDSSLPSLDGQGLFTIDRTYIFNLEKIVGNPKLGLNASLIGEPIRSFRNWLVFEPLFDRLYLPSIGQSCSLQVSRIDFLKIVGNISKHNFTRLDHDVGKIQRLLEGSGISVALPECYLILEDFYEYFFNNIFQYHSSIIAMFLNDIRIGIHDYLRPEFVRSYRQVDPAPKYEYLSPPGVESEFGRVLHWNLMNMVRTGLSFPKFTIDPSFLKRY